MGARETTGSDESAIACPMDCRVCSDPGDCEDCLDCLLWPRVVEELRAVVRPPRGPSFLVRSTDLVEARERLDVGRRVGLVARRFRRGARLTQRQLAAVLGWSRASMGRLEHDATQIPLGKVEALLRHTGHRLVIVEIVGQGEVDELQWGAADLLLSTSLRDREWTWHRP